MSALATQVTGWMFIAAAAMLWLGWTLLPVRIGAFFTPDDFARVFGRLQSWIWLFRIHLFGYIVTIMAFVALASLVSETPARVLLWPAVAVCTAGLLVSVLAQAFYYHFGAWGALDMHGNTPEELDEFVDKLQVPTEYVTCFVRFGRVFFGFGQVALAAGVLYGAVMPSWLGIVAILLGVAAIALTMGLPDSLDAYPPIFHLNVLWLAATGITVLRL